MDMMQVYVLIDPKTQNPKMGKTGRLYIFPEEPDIDLMRKVLAGRKRDVILKKCSLAQICSKETPAEGIISAGAGQRES